LCPVCPWLLLQHDRSLLVLSVSSFFVRPRVGVFVVLRVPCGRVQLGDGPVLLYRLRPWRHLRPGILLVYQLHGRSVHFVIGVHCLSVVPVWHLLSLVGLVALVRGLPHGLRVRAGHGIHALSALSALVLQPPGILLGHGTRMHGRIALLSREHVRTTADAHGILRQRLSGLGLSRLHEHHAVSARRRVRIWPNSAVRTRLLRQRHGVNPLPVV